MNAKDIFIYSVGYIEIYNEKIFDLLNQRTALTLRDDLQNKEVLVSKEEAILSLLHTGNKVRSAAFTQMNKLSSRSHAIFRIVR